MKNFSNSSGASVCTSAKVRSVQSPGVGLHQPRVLARLQADPRRDDLRRFPGAQQRTAPQRREAVPGGPLGQLPGLLTAGVVERDRLLALEAALEVVGGLAVAGEEDAVGGSHLTAEDSSSAALSRAAGETRLCVG